ncbi:AAA family ATPase [Aliiroseovarius lamellibrachiae]|uniref:AAA family ATPase n=1 Tax=Aliiroseovarius lamellibrachiae TaxID=1924933 RepID=UPI001BE0DAFB|nr:AAA family ATPase [Aliiroseovarius lamellibrachiae]MBT2132498.1 AAA family ATPase [Aliiroseovarius lamellibrachiae]
MQSPTGLKHAKPTVTPLCKPSPYLKNLKGQPRFVGLTFQKFAHERSLLMSFDPSENSSFAQPGNADHGLLAVFTITAERGLISFAERDNIKSAFAVGAIAADALPQALNEALTRGVAAERSLAVLADHFQPNDTVELRALDPAGGGVSYNGCLGDSDEREKMATFIRRYNGLRNLYFGVNPRKADLVGTARSANSVDVIARRAVFFDLDNKDAPDVDPGWARTLEALRSLAPVSVLNSGNGFHVHLALDGMDGTDAVRVAAAPLKDAMQRLGADNMSDPARIARMPFTVNLPCASKLKRGNVTQFALPLDVPCKTAVSRSLEVVCSEVKAIAERLGLPGVQRKGNAHSIAALVSSSLGASGAPKRGRPAPSLEALRMLLAQLPNDGPFDSRGEWASIGHAIKGAAQEAGLDAEGRELFLSWSARCAFSVPEKDAEFWDTCRDPHTGWGTLMQALDRTNPAGVEAVKTVEAQAAFAGSPLTQQDYAHMSTLSTLAAACARGNTSHVEQGSVAMQQAWSNFTLSPAVSPAPSQISPRARLYGQVVFAGFISVVVAPGGAGKSALMMAEAVAMASGKALFNGDAPHHPLKVWVHNAEDPKDEQHRRLAAVLMHHMVSDAELGGRLFVTSGRELPLCLVRAGRDGPEVVQECVDGLVDAMCGAQVDVLVLDPLGAIHTLPENDNTAANILLGVLRDITEKTGAAIVLVHHTSKAAGSDMDTAGANAARGASAIVDGARNVRQVVRMTTNEAKKLRIPEDERHSYVRVANGKANLAPLQAACWRRLTPVSLGNATRDYPVGDSVVVVEDWVPPGPVEGTPNDLYRMQAAIMSATKRPRADYRAGDWVGWLIADTLGMDAGRGLKAEERTPEQAVNFQSAKDMLNGWLSNGGLKVVEHHDGRAGRPVQYVETGNPAIECEDIDTTMGLAV